MCHNVITGYAQTKWVSEQLVMEFARLGGRVLVLRPGRLLGSNKTSICPLDDFTIRLIASILELGVATRLDNGGEDRWQFDATPIDFCAQLIHQRAIGNETGIGHVFNTDTISFEGIVDSLGKSIHWVDYRYWLQLITRSASLAPLSSIFHEPVSAGDERSVFEILLQLGVFRCSSYETTIAYKDVQQLPPTKSLLRSYLGEKANNFSCTESYESYSYRSKN